MYLFPLLLSSLLPFLSGTVAQDDNIECSDSSLQTYLVSLIDVLYANGLTIYEDLLAEIVQADSGYDLLSSFESATSLTLLVPTDAAFQTAGIWSPFADQGETDLANLVAYHTLSGGWNYSSFPGSPSHGVASTMLGMASYANDTTSGSEAMQAMILMQGEGGTIVENSIYGNATTWGNPLDLSGTGLNNLVILPINTVIGFPVNLSAAVTMPTTTRSTHGLTKLTTAFDAVSSNGAAALDGVTSKGFTIFAPVDDAWTGEASTQANDSKVAPTMLGNHYTTSYSLYSAGWSSGSFPNLTVVSGQTLSITSNSSGAYIHMGTQSALILRSDITLENGVMHIIDAVLLAEDVSSSAPTTIATTNSGSATGAGTGTGAAQADATSTRSSYGSSSNGASSGASRVVAGKGAVTAMTMTLLATVIMVIQ
ncbi:hypothetical protein EHS25_002895 [Saitozyma podzolica]|uniref:FAS1 domain-containing protein n=1 Tax=Saitozyma podzolica TaxID=1890683 RepID=A0A427YC54_9TREE|nr:hypothetical protein EHS25_002895 [Saitozyma podzolica]